MESLYEIYIDAISDLFEDYFDEYLRPLSPDLVIIQIGIVDCAPRIFRPVERLILKVINEISLQYFKYGNLR